MAKQTAFSRNRLNNSIYPLTCSVRTVEDIDILYLTVASVEDVYGLIRDKLKPYLYIFDVGHDMEKDGIYLTLKEIAEKNKVAPDFMYEDDIIAIKKEKFRKFLTFPQHDFRMFDCDRILGDDEFKAFFTAAKDRVKNEDAFLRGSGRGFKYYISCHDDALLYCEARDFGLKSELLKSMLHDYFEAYIAKNIKGGHDVVMPPQEIADEMPARWKKLKIREEDTSFRDGSISAVIFDPENEAGQVVYKTGKKEWAIKYKTA